jgi:hypothetical protein
VSVLTGVASPPPVLTSISPGYEPQGVFGSNVIIAGMNLVSGGTPFWTPPGGAVSPVTLPSVQPQKILATINSNTNGAGAGRSRPAI